MRTSDYNYHLPEEKIARYPLPERDGSKLLVYNRGRITHSIFRSLDSHLPADAFLFFNNTRVIPARLHFTKNTGAVIEILLLHPLAPSVIPGETMTATTACSWQCVIGNLKRWPPGVTLYQKIGGHTLEADLRDRQNGIVDFAWDGTATFASILQQAGEMPLPPYMKRSAEGLDRERYQTIYSQFDGAVAAPTAGLHFTDDVFSKLDSKGIGRDFLTLHVSAGTFQPVKTDNPDEHRMHEEQVLITRANLRNLMTLQRTITAVGTTSLRTLESLYWFGARLLQDPQSTFAIEQTDPATLPAPPTAEALAAVAAYMDDHHIDPLIGETSIFIKPGYTFRVCQALITNFHQPSSTLVMLVAAFVGDDWKKIYEEALNNGYRFLSYGDSSLLIP